MSTDAERIALVERLRLHAESWMQNGVVVFDHAVGRDAVAEAAILLEAATALEAARAEEREACARADGMLRAAALVGKRAHMSELMDKDCEADTSPLVTTLRNLEALIQHEAAAIRNRTPSPPAEEKKT